MKLFKDQTATMQKTTVPAELKRAGLAAARIIDTELDDIDELLSVANNFAVLQDKLLEFIDLDEFNETADGCAGKAACNELSQATATAILRTLQSTRSRAFTNGQLERWIIASCTEMLFRQWSHIAIKTNNAGQPVDETDAAAVQRRIRSLQSSICVNKAKANPDEDKLASMTEELDRLREIRVNLTGIKPRTKTKNVITDAAKVRIMETLASLGLTEAEIESTLNSL